MNNTWRKIADIAKKLRFSTKDRKGVEDLKKADYVEYPQFAEAANKQEGYFCSTCEYFMKNRGKYSICKKLNDAQVQSNGCCNYWEIIDALDKTDKNAS